jgi:hypothetical protein
MEFEPILALLIQTV